MMFNREVLILLFPCVQVIHYSRATKRFRVLDIRERKREDWRQPIRLSVMKLVRQKTMTSRALASSRQNLTLPKRIARVEKPSRQVALEQQELQMRRKREWLKDLCFPRAVQVSWSTMYIMKYGLLCSLFRRAADWHNPHTTCGQLELQSPSRAGPSTSSRRSHRARKIPRRLSPWSVWVSLWQIGISIGWDSCYAGEWRNMMIFSSFYLIVEVFLYVCLNFTECQGSITKSEKNNAIHSLRTTQFYVFDDFSETIKPPLSAKPRFGGSVDSKETTGRIS